MIQTPTRLRTASVVVVCLLAALAAGCLTRSTSGVVDVVLDENKTLRVEGKPVAFDRLARAVRSAGATPETRIQVSLPADVQESDVRRIVRALATGGYPKVIFIKPRQAEAFVK